MQPSQTKDIETPKDSGTTGRFYLPALDGLRTIAFLMVWFCHALPAPRVELPPVSWHGALVQAGAYGVVVFFVLSSYLITRLLLTESERTGTIDLKAYYIRRTLRIWPLYFLIVALATVNWARNGGVPVQALTSLATFTSNWYWSFGGKISNFSAVLWSVAVEEQFYLVWPFVLLYVSKRYLTTLCYAMIVIAIVSRVIFAQNNLPGLWLSTLSHLDSLALGTLLALGSGRRIQLPQWAWYVAFAGAMTAIVIESKWFPLGFRAIPADAATAVAFELVPLSATVIVALAAASKKSLLEHPWMISVGRITYGLYCFHLVVLTYIHGRSPLYLAAALLVTYLLAWLSYNFYEKRFLRLKHRFERVPSRPD